MNIAFDQLTEKVPISGTTGPNGVSVRKINKLSDLRNSGVNFETYQIREGETLEFPSFADMISHKDELLPQRQVSRGSSNYFTLVKCISTYKGRKKVTYFSLPSLKRQDVNNTPVNPTWYDLGNDLTRLQALAAMGQISGDREVTIKVPREFIPDENGRPRPKQIQLKNEDGSAVIKDGKEVWVTDTRDAHPVTITPVPADLEIPAIPEGVSID